MLEKKEIIKIRLKYFLFFNPFSPVWDLRDAIQNTKEMHIKDVMIEKVNRCFKFYSNIVECYGTIEFHSSFFSPNMVILNQRNDIFTV
jgi:hypothetical protein